MINVYSASIVLRIIQVNLGHGRGTPKEDFLWSLLVFSGVHFIIVLASPKAGFVLQWSDHSFCFAGPSVRLIDD